MVLSIGAVDVPVSHSATASDSDFAVLKVKELPHETDVSSAAWSPDGKKVATLSNLFRRVTLWNSKTGAIIREFEIASSPAPSNSLALIRDGRSLLTTAFYPEKRESHAVAVLWDTSSGEIERYVPSPFADKDGRYSAARRFCVSRDGRQLALSISSEPGTPIALYTGDWSVPVLLPLPRDIPTAMEFSPDGRHLAVGTISGRLEVFGLPDDRLEYSIQAYEHGGGVALSYSPDGQFLATGFRGDKERRPRPDGTWETLVISNPLVIWDAASGKLVEAIPGTTQKIWQISWSPDGRILATGEDDHNVHFRSVDAPDRSTKAAQLPGPDMGVAFAPVGTRFVAVGGRTALIGEIVAPK
jgi:WD40 repeat protein